jgi:hypothetical protein
VYFCTLTERKEEVQVGRAILLKKYWLRVGRAEELATDEHRKEEEERHFSHGITRKQQKQRHGRGRRIIRSEPEA